MNKTKLIREGSNPRSLSKYGPGRDVYRRAQDSYDYSNAALWDTSRSGATGTKKKPLPYVFAPEYRRPLCFNHVRTRVARPSSRRSNYRVDWIKTMRARMLRRAVMLVRTCTRPSVYSRV